MRFRLLASCLAAGGVTVTAAQPPPSPAPTPAPAATETRPAVLAPVPVPRPPAAAAPVRAAAGTPAPAAPRTISPAVTAKISAAIAQAVPYGSLAPATSNSPTMAASDDPNVVMLDPIIVRDDRLRYAQERHLMTSKGWLAIARQRYPNAPTDGMAMFLLGQDLAIERRKEIGELQKLDAMSSSSKGPPDTQRLIDSTARPPRNLSDDFGEPFRKP